MVGRDAEANYKIAQELATKISRIPGAADVHVHQVVDQPEIRLNVDRVKASQLGLTQRDVTSSMLISLSGNGTVAPNYLGELDQRRQLQRRRADAAIRSIRWMPCCARRFRWPTTASIQRTPASSPALGAATNAFVGASPNGSSQAYGNPGAMPGSTQLLSNLVTVQRDYAPVIVNHYNVWPVFDVYANVDRRDLGGVGAEVEKIMSEESAASAARNHASTCAASSRPCNRPSSASGWA